MTCFLRFNFHSVTLFFPARSHHGFNLKSRNDEEAYASWWFLMLPKFRNIHPIYIYIYIYHIPSTKSKSRWIICFDTSTRWMAWPFEAYLWVWWNFLTQRSFAALLAVILRTGNFIRHEDSAIAAARDGLRTSQSSIRLQRLMKSFWVQKTGVEGRKH